MDFVQTTGMIPPNQKQYEQFISEKQIGFNKLKGKLSRMSDKLGGIDKYGDDYLDNLSKPPKKETNVKNVRLSSSVLKQIEEEGMENKGIENKLENKYFLTDFLTDM